MHKNPPFCPNGGFLCTTVKNDAVIYGVSCDRQPSYQQFIGVQIKSAVVVTINLTTQNMNCW